MLNWPNNLTLIRIFSIPFIVLLLYFPNKVTCVLASSLFVIASITDYLDGFLARRYNLVTPVGELLDPMADKLLICSSLIMLVKHGWLDGWIAIVIIGREIMVTGLRAISAEKGIIIPADRYGKMKMFLQIIAISLLIIHYPLLGVDWNFYGYILIWVALLLTVFSGINYLWKSSLLRAGQSKS